MQDGLRAQRGEAGKQHDSAEQSKVVETCLDSIAEGLP